MHRAAHTRRAVRSDAPGIAPRLRDCDGNRSIPIVVSRYGAGYSGAVKRPNLVGEASKAVGRIEWAPAARLVGAVRSLVGGERLVSYSARDARGIPIDLRLGHVLDRRGGFFVEAGANDGLFQSNTALLEKSFDWSGILVEPSPRAYRHCRQNRRARAYNCALVAFDCPDDLVVGDFDGHSMASIGGSRLGRDLGYEVPARTLQAILDENDVSHVDFMSLDSEGYELEILRGCDFTRVTFGHILIELYPSNYEPVVSYLHDAGYQLLENYTNYDVAHNDYLFGGIPRSAPTDADSRTVR